MCAARQPTRCAARPDGGQMRARAGSVGGARRRVLQLTRSRRYGGGVDRALKNGLNGASAAFFWRLWTVRRFPQTLCRPDLARCRLSEPSCCCVSPPSPALRGSRAPPPCRSPWKSLRGCRCDGDWPRKLCLSAHLRDPPLPVCTPLGGHDGHEDGEVRGRGARPQAPARWVRVGRGLGGEKGMDSQGQLMSVSTPRPGACAQTLSRT